jgi:hypothetical protein
MEKTLFRDPDDDFTRAETVPDCRSFSSAALLELDPHHTDWLVDGRLPRVGSSMLIGERGVGKTTLAQKLALATARRKPWLGFEVVGGSVLFIDLERDLEEVRVGFVENGLTPIDDVHVIDPLRSSELLARLHDYIKSLTPALVVVNGLRAWIQAEELNVDAPRSTPLDRILSLPRETGTHLMIVHDLQKGLAVEMGGLLGSTEREIDTILMMSRHGETRLLRSIQKRGSDLVEPVAVTSHSREHSSPMRVHPELERRLLMHLKRSGELETQREAASGVPEFSLNAVGEALDTMHRRGRLIRTGDGSHDKPFRYTGFDRVDDESASPWLRRVRPWADVTRSC